MNVNNYGCLNKYVNVLSCFSNEKINESINKISSLKGFLCNWQIPMVIVLGNSFQKIAEIGCWHGRTTNALSMLPSFDRELWCIDTFMGSEEHQSETHGRSFKDGFIKNVSHIPRVTILEKTSEEASSDFEDNFFDLVWIDAAHDYDNVKLDVNSWHPKLKKGGLMVGHDYPEPSDPNGGFEELTRAVNETVRDSPLFSDFGWFCGIWGAIKN